MPEAVSSIAFEIDPRQEKRLVAAHRKAVAALKAADVGFLEGGLYRMEDEGAYFDLWRWESAGAAEAVTALRVTLAPVKAYVSLIENEPLYMEGVSIDQG
ncbi:hypothetical protein [Luteimonas kalidii]|uniref:ABM domain-containing protein n=1 Tax=Luteimonas kalidii TaxID=3042025 RepID=A0ABT6JPU6_9GAMM|nr:hypothetical protein [Luteimonas kalidii]MDH5832705.1 hypothetical protein [Luteimonas kalidii]